MNCRYSYSRRILTGLLFSCVGDALLIWPQYFTYGMAAFGVAQIMYTAAFGFKPLNAPLGVVLYTSGTTGELAQLQFRYS
jgi:Predicted membrane protein